MRKNYNKIIAAISGTVMGLLALTAVSGTAFAQVSTSTDATSTTATSTMATSTVMEPVITGVMATSSNDGTMATIMWTTDENASSQVGYGLTIPYSTFSAIDTNQVMNHSLTLSNLTPNTPYHFEVISTDASSTVNYSPDQVFMTSTGMSSTTSSSTTSTTTATSTTGTTTSPVDLQAWENAIALLQQELNQLISQFNAYLASIGQTGTIGNGGTGTTTNMMTGMISPTNLSVVGGGSIDFTGSQFGHEESVRVTLNGNTITSAHADGGGNFSTGSLSIPNVASSTVETYMFTGVNSGITGSATVTVNPRM